MKKLKCETCGGTEIKKIDNDLFECQSCGVQYSSAEAKKLLVEISGVVPIDKTNEIDNLLQRANEYYMKGEGDRGLEYCNRVLDIDAQNMRAKKLLNLIKDNIFIFVKSDEWFSGSAKISYDGNFIKKIKCGETLRIKASFGRHTIEMKNWGLDTVYEINVRQCENLVLIRRNAVTGILYLTEV